MVKILLVVLVILGCLAAFLIIAINKLKPKETEQGQKTGDNKKKEGEKDFGIIPIIVLIAVAVVVSYFGIYSGSWKIPPAREIGPAVWDRWLWILIFCIILAILIVLKGGEATKALLWGLVGAMTISFIVLPIKGCADRKGEQKQMTSPTQTDILFVLRIPAKGDSSPINPPAGYKVTFTGNGFIAYCGGYPDRPETIIGDPVNPCVDGFTFIHVQDISGTENTVTYKYVRP